MLSAEWRDLMVFNFAVDPQRLAPYVPPGVELETYDGAATLSLSAFAISDQKMMGVGWPGYRSFLEVTLRFYVREGERRGYAFVSELVPKRYVAFVARRLYNKPHRYMPMWRQRSLSNQALSITHTLRAGARDHVLHVEAHATPREALAEEAALLERDWGFGTTRQGALLRYRVSHPRWRVHPVLAHALDWQPELVFGQAWAALRTLTPRSVWLVDGSRVEISGKRPA